VAEGYTDLRKKYYAYFRGNGLDVGPFDKPFIDKKTAKQKGLTIEYVDAHSPERIKELFDEIPDLHPVKSDYVANVSQGFDFTDHTYSFMIMSHVLEHVANPFLTFAEASRKLKSGGILYIGLPDERFSDDNGRPITSYEELVQLYHDGVRDISDDKVMAYLKSPTISQVAWVKKALASKKGMPKEAIEREKQRSFHVHVWNSGTTFAHFINFVHDFHMPLELVHLDTWESNGYENVLIFRKLSTPKRAARKLVRHAKRITSKLSAKR
jgi:predicted SAM-dependent methyltransferase